MQPPLPPQGQDCPLSHHGRAPQGASWEPAPAPCKGKKKRNNKKQYFAPPLFNGGGFDVFLTDTKTHQPPGNAPRPEGGKHPNSWASRCPPGGAVPAFPHPAPCPPIPSSFAPCPLCHQFCPQPCLDPSALGAPRGGRGSGTPSPGCPRAPLPCPWPATAPPAMPQGRGDLPLHLSRVAVV